MLNLASSTLSGLISSHLTFGGGRIAGFQQLEAGLVLGFVLFLLVFPGEAQQGSGDPGVIGFLFQEKSDDSLGLFRLTQTGKNDADLKIQFG